MLGFIAFAALFRFGIGVSYGMSGYLLQGQRSSLRESFRDRGLYGVNSKDAFIATFAVSVVFIIFFIFQHLNLTVIIHPSHPPPLPLIIDHSFILFAQMYLYRHSII
jgi:hypothetical protein